MSGEPPAHEPPSLRLWLAAGACVIAMLLAYFLLPLHRLGPDRTALAVVLLVAALSVLALLLLRQIHAVLLERPGAHPGVVIPLLMCLSVLVFSAAYFVLAHYPGEFSGLVTRVDALYFTLVTLATVGYGDITPTGQGARVVTMLQILYNFVILTAAATALTRRIRSRIGTRGNARPGRGRRHR
ncbi:potassium channel family protein [Streptomyces sp. NPDC028635]|uniref:potassium channel family protein n=1 Tax=Streptomyces sp. NPDC028635 TaxID=3154800 RepID=UPI00340E9312